MDYFTGYQLFMLVIGVFYLTLSMFFKSINHLTIANVWLAASFIMEAIGKIAGMIT